MAVSKEDRADYEQGRRDREDNSVEGVLRDITIQHPESDAYYKGRDGDQLDEDEEE
jgi:hypothetical protein